MPDPFRPGGLDPAGGERARPGLERTRPPLRQAGLPLVEDPVKAAIMQTGLPGPEAAKYLKSRT
nr:hypothetical protein Ade03nite_30050 [Actinoplanes derwentensis]